MRALAAVLAVGALAAAAFGMQQESARANASAGSKVVDRTVSCAVGLTGGIHEVEVSANTGTRLIGSKKVWKLLASASVEDFGTRASAGVSAGNPMAPLAPGFPARPDRLSFSAPPICKPAAKFALSSKGLVRTPVDALSPNPGEGIDCYPGNRVLIRVRGIFARPTSLHSIPGPHLLGANGTVIRGYLAVRSVSGKPLAYAEVFQNGKATLYVARSCDR